GIKGGIVGGLVMPVPAMIYGLVGGHGIWLPINLLAGMVLPGIDRWTIAELESFHPAAFVVAVAIHLTLSLTLGLLYGVLLATPPHFPRPLPWGAVLIPLLWTAVSFVAASVVNPIVRELVAWPYFIASQFIFGIAAALVVMRFESHRPIPGGLLAGAV